MDEQNQFGRREMIRMHNVPEPPQVTGEYECVEDTVVKVLKDAGYEINTDMIVSAQRLPPKKLTGDAKGFKPITFKLTKRFTRNHLRTKKKHMRENKTFQTKHKGVFLTEDLTPIRQHISFKLRKDETIEKVWTIDGRIKCTKVGANEADKPYTIDSPHDLKKLGWTESQINQIIKENLMKIKG